DLPAGSLRLACGGDCGDTPHDGNFVADGLMSADVEPHPAMREVAWVYRPVTVSLHGGPRARTLRITNRRSFVGLDDLVASWELLVAGAVVDRGRLRTPAIDPNTSVTVPLPCTLPRGHDEVHLTVRWHSRRGAWWAPKDHLVAWDQVELRAPVRPVRSRAHRSAASSGSDIDDL